MASALILRTGIAQAYHKFYRHFKELCREPFPCGLGRKKIAISLPPAQI